MSRIDIELPDTLKDYLEQESRRRGYRDASEFVKSLLEAEQHRQVDAEIEGMLLEALQTPVLPLTHREFDEIRSDGLRILEERRRQ